MIAQDCFITVDIIIKTYLPSHSTNTTLPLSPRTPILNALLAYPSTILFIRLSILIELRPGLLQSTLQFLLQLP